MTTLALLKPGSRFSFRKPDGSPTEQHTLIGQDDHIAKFADQGGCIKSTSPSADVFADGEGQRVEILWAFYDKQEGKNVERWLPGQLFRRHSDGRCQVRADNGWVAAEAAPECVRVVEAKVS